MTMPHLMNCSHSPDGWCLDCVKELYDKYELENERLKAALTKARKYARDGSKRHPIGLRGFASKCGVSAAQMSEWTSEVPKTDPDIICRR